MLAITQAPRTCFAAICLAMIVASPAPAQRFQAQRHGPSQSVLLLFNCDASDMPGDGRDYSRWYDPDCFDSEINDPEGSSADRDQLEPILIAKTPGATRLTLRLVNANAKDRMPASTKVRIFNSAGKEILGPKTGDSYELSEQDLKALSASDMRLYAEGLDFARSASLELVSAGQVKDSLSLYVAPLLLAPDTLPAKSNYVFEIGGHRDSGQFVKNFQEVCERAAVQPKVIKNPQHSDVWVQDEFQWGHSYTPRAAIDVALHLPRYNALESDMPGLLAPKVGYVRPWKDDETDGASMDFGGNLEVSPPVKGYPFGRVYYGGQATPADLAEYPLRGKFQYVGSDRWYQHIHISDPIKGFFQRQKSDPQDGRALQEPIELHSDWLGVGHVDEFVSFIPANNARGFVLLHASPSEARKLLSELRGEELHPRFMRYGGVTTVDELLDLNPRDRVAKRVGFLRNTLEHYNERVDKIIMSNVDILRRELGLADDEIIALPTLFHNGFENKSYWQAEALTPGMVNLSAMNGYCLVPDPHIPAFRDDARKKLAAIGQKVEFIDDWTIYHVQMGEVHCGSNALRKATNKPWWSTTATGAKP